MAQAKVLRRSSYCLCVAVELHRWRANHSIKGAGRTACVWLRPAPGEFRTQLQGSRLRILANVNTDSGPTGTPGFRSSGAVLALGNERQDTPQLRARDPPGLSRGRRLVGPGDHRRQARQHSECPPIDPGSAEDRSEELLPLHQPYLEDIIPRLHGNSQAEAVSRSRIRQILAEGARPQPRRCSVRGAVTHANPGEREKGLLARFGVPKICQIEQT